jgi:acyl-CoA dehydrogenase
LLETAVATEAREVWRGLGAEGALDQPELGELIADLDRRLPLGVVLSVVVQVASALPLLRELAARSPLAGEVLEEALAGEAIVALAVTDGAAPGSDLLEAQTSLRETGDGWVLDGEKRWITNATQCDHALVLARHRPASHFTSFRWVLVPAAAEGVSSEPATTGLFAGSGLGHLRFDGVRLEPDHLVGPPGRGLPQFFDHVARERLAGALWARSLCRRVLRDTHSHLAAGRLWDNAAIRERFARCLVDLRCLDALCEQLDGGRTDAMVLKVAGAGILDRVLAECASLRGADAFRDGGEAELRAEATMWGIAGGATGALLAGIADHADDLLEDGG